MTNRDRAHFLRAMQEAFALHFLGCPLYREHCRREGFLPEHLRRQEDLPRVPYLFVTVLKHHKLVSVPEERIRLTLTSSGTGGEKSAIYLDGRSLRRITRIVHNIYGDLGMTSKRRTNYLCFTYDPREAKDLGTAFSDELLTGLTRVNQVFYAIRKKDGDWFLDVDAVADWLERFAAGRRPLRVLGFPAHTWEVLEECVSRRQRTYEFGPHSWVITGGGWKGKAGQEIPKDLFRTRVAQHLGIPRQNVRDLYGMVEHGVPYCECEFGTMHVPRYSQVYVRDPETKELLPHGKTGILHFLTPYHSSYPAISLLTTDIGHTLPDCPCGRKSQVLVLEGRGGLTKHKGCAIAALEVLA